MRNWRHWPGRFWHEVLTVSGPVGVAGIAIGGIASVSTGAWVFIPTAVVVGVAITWAAYKGIPGENIDPRKHIGQSFDLDLVSEMSPKPLVVGFAGITRSGKSTIVETLRHGALKTSRTPKIYATIIDLQQPDGSVAALLDGAGDESHQQW